MKGALFVAGPAGTGKSTFCASFKDWLTTNNMFSILTIHRGGIVKYMEETRKLMKNFNLPPAQMYRIENIFRSIDTSFNSTEDIQRVETHIENPLDNYGEIEEEILE